MRTFSLVLLLMSEAAVAQPSSTGPDPVVTGEDRMICRRVTRTATRMRTGRICHTQSQWARETGRAPDPNDPNATIDGASDTLEMAGEKVSTGDTGGFASGHETPLGPR